jgi:hypothetical protein
MDASLVPLIHSITAFTGSLLFEIGSCLMSASPSTKLGLAELNQVAFGPFNSLMRQS